jgi:hypothetical protein
MARNKKQKASKEKGKTGTSNGPWIKMRTGIIVIAITSLGMAVLTAWQAIPLKGLWEGILWGVLFGVFIWVVFFGMMLINRFLRR